jgi:CsoR family transcriptional regulator, copper-sensing transcriptional repressor
LQVLRQAISACAAAAVAASRDGHAHACVIGAEPGQQDERTEERMAAVGRLLRRG